MGFSRPRHHIQPVEERIPSHRRLEPSNLSSLMIITFTSGKGGVAKSTGALATCGLLARHFRVALVDLDPDAYATTMGLGQSQSSDPLICAPVRITHSLLERGELWLYRGGDAIDNANEAAVSAHIARCLGVADIIVVDTPPDRRRATVLAALRAASVVVIPVIPEFQSLAGLEKLLDSYRMLGIAAPVRALLSRWEAKTVLAQDVQRDLVSAHPGTAISAAIPKDQRAAEAPAAGLPVTLYAPRSAASLAYRTAVHEIAATGGIRIPKEAL